MNINKKNLKSKFADIFICFWNQIGLVERHGYPSEEHEVITEDGYHLQVHRIPGSPSKPKSKGKPVAYLQHGILASSDSLVLMGPGNDLGKKIRTFFLLQKIK